MSFWSELDAVRGRWDVLGHPFYVRWSAGELDAAELEDYSGQYRHAVVALADATAGAARQAEMGDRPSLEAHAREEAEHVALWDAFVDAVGGDAAATPSAETRACAQTWAGADDRGLLGSLTALYAIEAAPPAISDTKRAGLVEHYGVDAPAALEYFTLHAARDHEHAAEGRAMIDRHLDAADEGALLAEAEAVLRANWELLDGVERRAAR